MTTRSLGSRAPRTVALARAGVGLVAALALATTGCTSSSRDEEGAGDTSSANLRTITITQAPVTRYAPVWVADEMGFFEEEGLQVEFTDSVASGTAQIAMITSGQADLIATPATEILKARSEGLQFQIISSLQVYADTDDADNSGILVLDDSDITRPRDLDGKTVGVQGLQSQEDMKVKATIDQDGGDSTTVEFVQIAADAMAGLLESGEIDAASLGQPVVSLVLDSGGFRRIGGANWAALGGTPGFSVVSTPEWIEENADDASAVRAAIRKAVEWAEDPDNRDELNRIVAAHLDVDVEVIDSMTPDIYSADVSVDDLERLQSAMLDYGLLTSELQLESLIWVE